MESNFSDSMCRCCASEGVFKDFNSTYQWMGAEEVYADMLKDCFDITLTVSETINSGGICEVCITQLRNAFNFKKQVQYTEEQFKRKIEEMKFKTEIVKVEEAGEDDFPSDHNLSDDDFSSPEYDIPIIKMESSSESAKSKKRATKGATTRSKKAKTEDGETSAKRDAVEIVTRNTDQNHRNNLLIFSRNRANLREILRHTNATPIRSWNGIGYKCCLCSNIYPNTANLKEHFIKRHDMSKSTGPKDIKKICGREFRRLSVKLDITNLTCRVCQLEITDLKELLNHLKSTHTNMVTPDVQNHILPLKFYNDVIQCCGCTKEFNSFKTILEHMNEHTQNYICLYCSAGFINKSSLELHEGRHKKGEHRCKFCPKIFETASKKQNHERRSHLCVDRLSKCWHCGERFSGHRRKQLHMQDVHGIPMPVKEKVLCKICNKYYPDKNVYNKHMRRVHLVEKNHKCNFCEKEFFVVKELNQHLVTHTGEKNFQCYYCMKAFGRKSTLREHIRRHVNDKRFSCDNCGQRFTQKCSWRSHMLAKHGERV
ncbi:zinc finger and BTB domain-containing protein 17-like isoform X11 [Leptidea sinapis]|uniref:zinc finger and BTB domain-containing protein 17-like isoform X11 n=1 Tax=Leptidea sinapis TaxID=189913 RepID=UPI0021C27A31|nr:zinc finger and BTB domain-containing protein 17-like isoform X11 [Leptidea sinapis]